MPTEPDEVPILYGDGVHDDSETIRHLLRGGVAYCMRTERVISVLNFGELPVGPYRTVPVGDD